MPNLKKTPSKPLKHACPLCGYKANTLEEMKPHLLTCGIQSMKNVLKCPDCDYQTYKPSNFTRHKRRHLVKFDALKDSGTSWEKPASTAGCKEQQAITEMGQPVEMIAFKAE